MSNTNSDYKPGRTLIIFAIIVVFLFAMMAMTRTWTPRLGLDLRGGTTITLTAHASDGSANVPRENLETAKSIIQNRVDSLGVGESSVVIQGDDKIEVAVPNVDSDELVALVGTTARLNFRQVFQVTGVANANTAKVDSVDNADSDKNSASASPSAKATRGPAPNLPKDPPPSQTPRPQTPAAVQPALAEKLKYQPSEQDLQDFQDFECSDKFPDVADQPLIACNQEKTAKYLLGPVLQTGERVTDARAGVPQNDITWHVNLTLDAQGTEEFTEITDNLYKLQQPQSQLAIVLDKEVVSAPVIKTRIPGGHADISGANIDEKEARHLATTLRFGALPIDLETSEVNSVSPTLGGIQLYAGIVAGLIGLGLVIVYCFIYYRGLAVVVAGSLVMAGIITYTVIVLLGSALSFALNLPGIAGVILAVGVTVDSFVVYFERIRDDIREGHRLRSAIESGWRKARNTILMADGVQLLAAVVLYFLAIGAVKGFAFTLGVTTAIDLALVVFFTHPMMSLLGRTKFFGEGHSLSGFDPDHLGVTRESLLGRRNRARTKTTVKEATHA